MIIRYKQGLTLQDNTLRLWDMRPYAPSNRCMKIFTGHQHDYEKNLLKCDWSPDGSKVLFPPFVKPQINSVGTS